jgi:hypothetical protein
LSQPSEKERPSGGSGPRKGNPPPRRRSSADGRHTRVVDRLEIHGTPVGFRDLCERVVPPETR